MNDKNFQSVRVAYRVLFTPLTLNHHYIGYQADKDLGDYENRRKDAFINPNASILSIEHDKFNYLPHLISIQDFIAKNGCDTYEMELYGNGDTPSMQDIKKRRNLMAQYMEVYNDLYSPIFTPSLYSNIPDINNDDLNTATKTFIRKILKLIELRQSCFLTYNFQLFDESEKINDKLNKMSLADKYKALFSPIKKTYLDDALIGPELDNYLKFERGV